MVSPLTIIYSTHSHRPEAPRLRLVVPLKRDITPDEYQAGPDFSLRSRELSSSIPAHLQEIFDTDTKTIGNLHGNQILKRIHRWMKSRF